MKKYLFTICGIRIYAEIPMDDWNLPEEVQKRRIRTAHDSLAEAVYKKYGFNVYPKENQYD